MNQEILRMTFFLCAVITLFITHCRLEEIQQMVRVVLPHSLDSMPEMEPIPMSTNRTPNTPLSEIYLGQVGQMGFLDDISSESTKRLFLACVFEILVSLYNEIYMQGNFFYKYTNTSILSYLIIVGTNLPLTFAPENGHMLGGTLVNITGPCFKPDTRITCRFNNMDAEGVIYNENRAACVMPWTYAEGWVDFEIALDGGPYYWKGQFFVGKSS